MSIAAAPSLSLECSTSYGLIGASMKPCVDGQRTVGFSGMRCKKSLLGSTQTHWLPIGRNLCPSRVSVAADYSDSVSDSSNYRSDQGFHPLEEITVCKRARITKLTSAEIARTTVEARSSALLVFPAIVHREPHEQVSWAEFQYAIDDYGDMIFEVFDDENIIEDRGARNPVNVFIGMDMSIHEKNKMIVRESSYMDPREMSFEDSPIEDMETEDFDSPVDWGMPDSSRLVHPIYFSKCLSKAVNEEYDKDMDYPSNGVSIFGCLRPVYPDDEFYLRRLFHGEVDEDVYDLDWKDADFASSSSRRRGGSSNFSPTLYRLDILKIELFSLYGVQSEISLDDYLDAEPDLLVHSTSAIVERFSKKGIHCNVALKAFCRKKGHYVEEAMLIGVDSLGMDVRVHSGIEVQTHRFPFKNRARSEAAAEKQIQQLLFPRSQRKKLRTDGDGYRKADPY